MVSQTQRYLYELITHRNEVLDMKKEVLIGIVLLLVLVACQKAPQITAPDANNKPINENPSPVVAKQLEFSKIFEVDKEYTESIAVGDLNNDGFDDVVMGVVEGPSAALINNKDGTFTKNLLINKDYNTQAVAIINLDKDSYKDVVVGNANQGILVLKNNGDGSFSIAQTLPNTIVTSIAVADFDKDGYQDFVIGTDFKDSTVYFNDKGNGFTPHVLLSKIPVTSVVATDMNGDGIDDIIMGVNRKPTKVYLSDGNRKFTLVAQLDENEVRNTYAIAVSDVDSDGKLDIIQGNNKQPNLVYFNKGNNVFESQPMFGEGNTYAVLAADLDKNGVDEIIIGNYEQTTQTYTKHDGEYKLLKELPTHYVRDLGFGNFDNEGNLDLAIARYNEMSQIYLS